MATPQTDPTTGLPYTYPKTTVAGDPIPQPSRPSTFGIKSSVIVATFDSGAEQRRIKAAPRKTFELHYVYLSMQEYQAIRDFYLKVLNCYSFYWTDVMEKITYVVRFDQDTFAGNYKFQGPKGPGYEVAIKLVQVL